VTVERYADLARSVLAARPGLGPVRLVAVDGPAGSGKTTFAGRLAAALRDAGSATASPTAVATAAGGSVASLAPDGSVASLAGGGLVAEIHTDDLLEGWTDILNYWPRLEEWILGPLSRGEPGRYRRYDWVAGRFADDWLDVPVPDVLLVEGVASARAAIRPRLTLAALVTAGPDVRLARGIARDGEALREHWERWMLDEDRHFAADDTAVGAHVVVDGAPTVPHDPAREFVRL